MAAPEGNRFWEARASHGRPALYETPDELWSDCVEYFEWVEANPLKATEPVKYAGEGRLMELPKMRAMTIVGLCNFLQIGTSTWADYKKKQDFSDITTRVEGIIFQQKFEGASADLLNPNIIARELGLADKQDHTGKIEVTKIERRIVKPDG
jgi:hypothetical protein